MTARQVLQTMTLPEFRAWILMSLDEADERDDDHEEVDPDEMKADEVAAIFGAKKVVVPKRGKPGVAQHHDGNKGRQGTGPTPR